MPGAGQCKEDRWTGCSEFCKVFLSSAQATLDSAPQLEKSMCSTWFSNPCPGKKDSAQCSEATPPTLDSLMPINVHPDYSIFDIKVYEGDGLKRGLQQYYSLCKEHAGLLVTTSCFSTWLKARKTNGGAKLIPAIPASSHGDSQGKALRVFFFDDNINLHLGGSCSIDGICNLRDVSTGEYVDFSIGQNGFEADHAYRHTVIHHSSQYQNVLVQANILDAMSNRDYFSSIVQKYAKPDEKLLVFFDVNGTLLWDDTVSGKGMSEVLLSTMFRFAEVRPRDASDFTWDDRPAVHLDKRMTLRQLVSEISNKDADFYTRFWNNANCSHFLRELAAQADFGWQNDRCCLTHESFFYAYQEYMDEMRQYVSMDGITSSWFEVWERLRDEGHIAVLNSFGVDTQRVVARSVPDERDVVYITIDYNLWGQKDLTKWGAQFQRQSSKTSAQATAS